MTENQRKIAGFPERLKWIAKRFGGPEKVARKARIARRTLGDWMAGNTEPKLSSLIQIADATGVSIEWLAGGKGPEFAEHRDYALRIAFAVERLGGIENLPPPDEIYMDRGRLENAMRGNYMILPPDLLARFASAAGVDLTWLNTGRGDVPDGFETYQPRDNDPEAMPINKALVESVANYVLTAETKFKAQRPPHELAEAIAELVDTASRGHLGPEVWDAFREAAERGEDPGGVAQELTGKKAG